MLLPTFFAAFLPTAVFFFATRREEDCLRAFFFAAGLVAFCRPAALAFGAGRRIVRAVKTGRRIGGAGCSGSAGVSKPRAREITLEIVEVMPVVNASKVPAALPSAPPIDSAAPSRGLPEVSSSPAALRNFDME